MIHGLEVDSFFMVSNAANFDALVPSVIGRQPLPIKASLRWVCWPSVAAPL